MEDKLKTLKELEFEQITDAYFNKSGNQRFSKRKAVFTYHLRKEMIKHYKMESNEDVKKFILKIFDLNEEVINDEKKLYAYQSGKDFSSDKENIVGAYSHELKEKLARLKKVLDAMPEDEIY